MFAEWRRGYFKKKSSPYIQSLTEISWFLKLFNHTIHKDGFYNKQYLLGRLNVPKNKPK